MFNSWISCTFVADSYNIRRVKGQMDYGHEESHRRFLKGDFSSFALASLQWSIFPDRTLKSLNWNSIIVHVFVLRFTYFAILLEFFQITPRLTVIRIIFIKFTKERGIEVYQSALWNGITLTGNLSDSPIKALLSCIYRVFKN